MWNKFKPYGHLLLPGSILILALLLRLFFISNLTGQVVWSDEQKNLSLAENWSSGKGYVLANGQTTAIIPAGYPFLLGLLRWLGLFSIGQIRLVQVMIGVLAVAVAGELSRRYFGRRTGLMTMLFFALYPYFVFLPGTILATSFYCLLALIGMLLWLQGVSSNNYKLLFVAGLVWGLATLTVTTALIWVVLLWLWQAGNIHKHWRQVTLKAVVFFLGFGIMVMPWILRNHYKLGVWTLATNGGYNFWLGNNPGSWLNNPSAQPTPDSLQQRLIRAGDEAVQDAIFSREALLYIREAPVDFIGRTTVKALYFWRLDPSPVTSSYTASSRVVRIIGWLSFAPLLLLALFGFYQADDRQRSLLKLWLGMAVFYTLFHAVMIVKVRFRLPLDQFVIIAAAAGSVRLWEVIRHTKWNQFYLTREKKQSGAG